MADDFDFDLADDLTKKKPPTKKDLEIENAKLKKQIATSGSPTAAIIKEARELAGSKKGLNIDKFCTKHRLINIDIEQLLRAPLNKDGMYA